MPITIRVVLRRSDNTVYSQESIPNVCSIENTLGDDFLFFHDAEGKCIAHVFPFNGMRMEVEAV